MKLAIIGAGLSGLIAATQFPQASVYEASGADSIAHKALLRFRSDTLSRLTGIPFRRVLVRKSIWHQGAHHPASIHLANLYSIKTNGGYLDRSIWNLDPAERYIAPEDIQLQLAQMIGNRLHWNTPIQPVELTDEHRDEVMISTMPMPLLLKMLGWDAPETFRFKSIRVDRFRIKNADLFQTIYYPDPTLAVYRASITGNLLIMEHIEDEVKEDAVETRPCFDDVLASFGLRHGDVELIELSHCQRFGKIAPLEDEKFRRDSIFRATVEQHIYSLGRFATWRNILLDDVVDDIAVIKRMIAQGHYAAAIQHINITPRN